MAFPVAFFFLRDVPFPHLSLNLNCGRRVLRKSREVKEEDPIAIPVKCPWCPHLDLFNFPNLSAVTASEFKRLRLGFL